LEIFRNRSFEPTTDGKQSERLVDYWITSSARNNSDCGIGRPSERSPCAILAHLGEPISPPRMAPAHGPPPHGVLQ
jgi:hypothetical protein